eukprot:scpid42130/ scgid18674/ 
MAGRHGRLRIVLVAVMATVLSLRMAKGQGSPSSGRCVQHFNTFLCSRLGLLTIPLPIPATSTYLFLDHNAISVLGEKAFGDSTHLTHIYLNHNTISRLSALAFSGLVHLHTLLLNNNKISRLPANLFHDCTSLTLLNLSSNSLAVLPAALFSNASAHARSLDLTDNPLRKTYQLCSVVSFVTGTSDRPAVNTRSTVQLSDALMQFYTATINPAVCASDCNSVSSTVLPCPEDSTCDGTVARHDCTILTASGPKLLPVRGGQQCPMHTLVEDGIIVGQSDSITAELYCRTGYSVAGDKIFTCHLPHAPDAGLNTTWTGTGTCKVSKFAASQGFLLIVLPSVLGFLALVFMCTTAMYCMRGSSYNFPALPKESCERIMHLGVQPVSSDKSQLSMGDEKTPKMIVETAMHAPASAACIRASISDPDQYIDMTATCRDAHARSVSTTTAVSPATKAGMMADGHEVVHEAPEYFELQKRSAWTARNSVSSIVIPAPPTSILESKTYCDWQPSTWQQRTSSCGSSSAGGAVPTSGEANAHGLAGAANDDMDDWMDPAASNGEQSDGQEHEQEPIEGISTGCRNVRKATTVAHDSPLGSDAEADSLAEEEEEEALYLQPAPSCTMATSNMDVLPSPEPRDRPFGSQMSMVSMQTTFGHPAQELVSSPMSLSHFQLGSNESLDRDLCGISSSRRQSRKDVHADLDLSQSAGMGALGRPKSFHRSVPNLHPQLTSSKSHESDQFHQQQQQGRWSPHCSNLSLDRVPDSPSMFTTLSTVSSDLHSHLHRTRSNGATSCLKRVSVSAGNSVEDLPGLYADVEGRHDQHGLNASPRRWGLDGTAPSFSRTSLSAGNSVEDLPGLYADVEGRHDQHGLNASPRRWGLDGTAPSFSRTSLSAGNSVEDPPDLYMDVEQRGAPHSQSGALRRSVSTHSPKSLGTVYRDSGSYIDFAFSRQLVSPRRQRRHSITSSPRTSIVNSRSVSSVIANSRSVSSIAAVQRPLPRKTLKPALPGEEGPGHALSRTTSVPQGAMALPLPISAMMDTVDEYSDPF